MKRRSKTADLSLVCISSIALAVSVFTNANAQGTTPIGLGETVSGSISTNGERDLYSFTVTGGPADVVIEMGGFDTFLELRNSSGGMITSDDDSGSSPWNSRISRRLDNGTYTIVARGYSSNTGNYQLRLTRGGGQPEAVDVYENDNSRDAATNIAVGVPQEHTIAPAGDVDWIRVSAISGRRYTLTFSGANINLEGNINLGVIPLATYTSPSPGGDVAVLTPSIGEDVTYYISVQASNAQTGTYTVTIREEGVVFDVNGDGMVSLDDVAFVLEILVGERATTSRADVNNDGLVNVQDALLVLRNLPRAKLLSAEYGEPVILRSEDVELNFSGLGEGVIVLERLEEIALGQMVFDYDPELITDLQISSSSEGLLVFPRQEEDPVEGRVVVDVLNLQKKTAPTGQIKFTLKSKSEDTPALFQVDQSIFADWGTRIHAQREELVIEIQPLPRSFALFQNHPNPFNPETVIRFDLPQDTAVRLEVFDMLGQRVRTLVAEELPPGSHQVQWDGRDKAGLPVSSGVYFYHLQAGTFSDRKKMLLLR